MATRDASTTTKPADHESALDHWRWLQVCLHSLTNPGWERRLHPLAQQMVAKRLVRARGDVGAPLRRVELCVLREALCRLLRQGDETKGECAGPGALPMNDAPVPAAPPDGSVPVPPAPLRTEVIPVRVTAEEHIALKTRAHAAGLGTSTFMRLRSLERLDFPPEQPEPEQGER